jgi:hypothetical protein
LSEGPQKGRLQLTSPSIRSSEKLTAKGVVEAPEMVSMAKEYGIEVEVREEGFLNVDGYYALLHKEDN